MSLDFITNINQNNFSFDSNLKTGDETFDSFIGSQSVNVVDKTLTKEGFPADAKAVGDALEKKQPKGNYITSIDGLIPNDKGEISIESIKGKPFTTDETLTLSKEGVLSVNTAASVERDNTLPITSAAVATQVGNIEIILQTI